MASYEIYIRCRIIWLSLAIASLHVALIASLANAAVAEPVSVSPDDLYEELPSDGHLNSHPGIDLPVDVDCKCRQHTQSSSTSATRQSSGGTRIFYLVILHNVHTLRDAVHLFRALRGPPHTVVFHVDKKVQHAIDQANDQNSTLLQTALQSLQDEILSCPCGSRVDLQAVHSVEWSKWSMNLPTLWGMQLAASEPYKDKWDFFINLSGDTLPVYTPSAMSRILSHLSHYNFVTSRSCETGLVPTNVYDFPESWHKRKHYTNADRDPPPIIHYNDSHGQPQSTEIDYYFGSQWVVLRKDFVQYLALELDRNDGFVARYRDHLMKKGKVMTDETFLPTILMHVPPFNETLPELQEEGGLEGSVVYTGNVAEDLHPLYSIRYERMDEHFPSPLRGYYPSHPRYEVPATPVEGVLLPPNPHNWGPYYLGVYDLQDIADSGALFIRKTSSVLDPNLYSLLPVDHWEQIPRIQWPPAGVQASEVPSWRLEKLRMMKSAVKKAQKEGQPVPTNFEKEIQRLEKGGKATPTRQAPGHEEEDEEQLPARRELEGLQEKEDL